MNAPIAIAQATLAAAHKRDHAENCNCHPHCVEVINLGRDAAVVCHDCGFELGFCDQATASAEATAHCRATA